MELVTALAASILFAIVFKRAIKSFPVVFYILAILLVLFFLNPSIYSLAPMVTRALYPFLQRCLFAFGLFVVVMFIGVLPEDSRLRRYFMPIRGELSIIAALLTLGHVVNYLNAYINQFLLGFNGMPVGMVISFLVSAILFVALAALTITSFNFVRRRMSATLWKKLQWFAYPFFLLIYAHLVLILLPTVSAFDQKSFVSIIIYTVIFLLYIVLRLRKMMLDERSKETRKGRAAEKQASHI